MKINDNLIYDSLKKIFGFDEFKGLQKQVINSICEDKNTLVIMPTGGGKSLCYQLPALIKEGTTIVVSPLIALMKNQVDQIRGFSNTNGIAHVLNSTLTKDEQEKVKDDVKNGVTKLLYMAPESLSKDSNIEFLKSNNISLLAIDEAQQTRDVEKTLKTINDEHADSARDEGLFGQVTGIIGGIIGFVVGGPTGAMIGYQVGKTGGELGYDWWDDRGELTLSDYADIEDYVLYEGEDTDPDAEIHGDDEEPINMDEKEEFVKERVKPKKESLGESLLEKVEKELPTKVREVKERE